LTQNDVVKRCFGILSRIRWTWQTDSHRLRLQCDQS